MKKLLALVVLAIVVYYGSGVVKSFFNKVESGQSNVDKKVTKQVDSWTAP